MALTDFNKQLFSQLSASAADPADATTVFKNRQRVPKVLKEADFFDQSLIDTTRIIKQDGKFYVPVAKENFRTMTTNFIESKFTTSVAAQLSSSFNNKFNLSSLPTEILILGEDGAAATASFTESIVGGIGNTTITFTNTSTAAGGATWSFAFQQPIGINHEIHQSEFTASWAHLFNPTTLSGSSLFNNTNPNTASGSSPVGVGTSIFINGTDSSDGQYVSFRLKGKIFGDGEESEFSASFVEPTSSLFIQDREYVVYSDTIKVASSSFLYHPSRPDRCVQDDDEVTLFYPVSGTTAIVLPFSGSAVASQSGSLLYSNATLTQAAANGFYYPTGRKTLLGDYNNTDDLVFGAHTGSFQLVPRIYTASFTTQIIG